MTTRIDQPALPGMPAPARKVKAPMPAWLLEQIQVEHPEAFGHHAHWRVCGRCGVIVLRGADWTSDWAGEYDVDPARLDTTTELESLQHGRRTFEVLIRDKDKTLRSRDPWRIRAKTPEAVADPVVPLHRCNEPLGEPMDPKKFVNNEWWKK